MAASVLDPPGGGGGGGEGGSAAAQAEAVPYPPEDAGDELPHGQGQGDFLREAPVIALDASVSLPAGGRLKGGPPHQQGVQKNSQRPAGTNLQA